MAAILGLCSTETYAADRFKNVRRSVQYYYPNGAAVLTGILSLMDEESTNDPEFSHWEKRFVQTTTITKVDSLYAGTGDGYITTCTDATGATPGDATVSATWTAGSFYRVYAATTSGFRIGQVLKIAPLVQALIDDLTGVITAITTNYFVVRATNTVAAVLNDTVDVGGEISVVGTAFAQGVTDLTSELSTTPTKFTNYTQIFRTPFSMTGTALKTPLLYDVSGPYKDKSKENSIRHMVDIEQAMLFGNATHYFDNVTTGGIPTTGVGLPTYTTGGILYYLRLWEMAASTYRGSASALVTLDSDDDKRIINNTTGTMSEKLYDKYLERLFRYTNNTSNEKLCLCGSGFLQVMNQLYRSKTVLNSDLPLTSTYGMNVVKHTTPFGTIFYKTHPLFTWNATLRYNALFCDVKNLKYRPMEGRDTELLKNRQAPDADYRKDEWFTECGLEMWYPESFMYLRNVRDYIP